MITRYLAGSIFLYVAGVGLVIAGQSNPSGPLLQKIKAVGKEGQGNVEAAKAQKQLTALGPTVLVDVLTALDDANPVAANYLRAAAETIIDRALAAKQNLPAADLEKFVLDTKHAGPARKLALELLTRVDPKAEDRLVPVMLDDPGADLRREAVVRLLKEAEELIDAKDAKAKSAFEKCLKHARDRDQVELIAKRLKTLGVDIDLAKHFGFIADWMIVGPFENAGGVGFKTAYPPEQKVDPAATYAGKNGKKVSWQNVTAKTKPGEQDVTNLDVVDLNKIIGPLHGAVAYGYTVVHAEKEMPVEMRAASNNAVQIFLNGKKIYGREEYHHGVEMDQHSGKGKLKAGANGVLIKVLQNEQTEDWAQLWSFQLRITDALGAAAPVAVVLNKNAPMKN